MFTAAPNGRGTLIDVKVVPGASRTRIMGRHGDALRVQIAKAAERGRANEALCELFADTLGVPRRDVCVAHGLTSPYKTLVVYGLTPEDAARRLGS